MPDPLNLLAKLRRCPPADRALLAEAFVLLLIAAPLLRLLHFRTIGRLVSRALPGPPRHDPALIRRIGWAVDRAARRSPLRALCFEQGLAAQWMLRRRGIDSTLLFGAAPRANGARPIDAHVWVQSAGQDVCGTPEPGRYAVLATFPAGRTTQAGAAPA
ncbi:MAG: hypothetical protein RIS94_974 [Pseudomonadota bacterium]|jgi:hypothetical protein